MYLVHCYHIPTKRRKSPFAHFMRVCYVNILLPMHRYIQLLHNYHDLLKSELKIWKKRSLMHSLSSSYSSTFTIFWKTRKRLSQLIWREGSEFDKLFRQSRKFLAWRLKIVVYPMKEICTYLQHSKHLLLLMRHDCEVSRGREDSCMTVLTQGWGFSIVCSV